MRRLVSPILVALVMTLVPGVVPSASAAPILFTYTGTITDPSPGIPGILTGDTITVQVIADNGGTTTISQSWDFADLVSATATAGTYSATYIDDFFFFSNPIFQTDALGALVAVDFQGTTDSLVNSDNFGVGGGVRLFGDALRDFNFNFASYEPILFVPDAIPHWTVSTVASPVPEPASLTLLGLGLAGLGARGWRQRKP